MSRNSDMQRGAARGHPRHPRRPIPRASCYYSQLYNVARERANYFK